MVHFALSPAHAKYPDNLVLQQIDSSEFDIGRQLDDDNAVVLGQMLKGEHGECQTDTLVISANSGMSLRGAQALATGISQSNIKWILFKGEEMMELEIKRTLLQGIAASSSIRFLLQQSPTDADSFDEICRCLDVNTNIMEFHFRATPSLTERGAQVFARNMGKSKLTRLAMSRTTDMLGDHEVTRRLCKGIRQIKTLKKLELEYFSFDRLDNVLPAIMKSLRSLEHLSLQKYGRFPRSLSESLGMAPSLTSLELKVGGLSEADMRSLSNGLQNSKVTKLTVAGTGIDDASVHAFVERWPRDSPIKKLDFHGNFIGPEGALLLIRAANERPGFESLDLSNNPIGYPGLAAIGELFPALQIKCLVIFYASVELIHQGDEASAGAEVVEAAKKRAARSLVEGIKLNVHTQLCVFGGALPLEAEREIGFYSYLNINGHYLLSNRQGVASAVWCHVLAKYSKPHGRSLDASLVYFFLLEQPHLVQMPPSSAMEIST